MVFSLHPHLLGRAHARSIWPSTLLYGNTRTAGKISANLFSLDHKSSDHSLKVNEAV